MAKPSFDHSVLSEETLNRIADMRLMICVPSGGWPAIGFLHSVVQLILELGTLANPPFISLLCIDSSQVHRNREFLANLALSSDATDFLWLDDDMVFKPEAVLVLMSRDLPFVSANYPRRRSPIMFTAHHLDHETLLVTDKDSTGLEKAGGVGFGMALIKREMLEAIKPPRFAPVWKEDIKDYLGEDLVFCHKALQAGFDIWVDHDASKLICHAGTFLYSWEQANG